ncbi:hypothetical protein WDU94_010569 [Cyamophila willieti]
MGMCSRWPLQLEALLIVLAFHVCVNVLNRVLGCYINVSMLWQDECDSPGSDVFSCSLFVFLTLLWLIACRPKQVRRYGIPLIQAELLLQLIHAIIICRVFSLRLCDVLPSIGDNGIGCVNIFKVLFAIGLLYLTLALVYITMKVILQVLRPKADDDCDAPPDCSIVEDTELLSLLPCCGTLSPGSSRFLPTAQSPCKSPPSRPSPSCSSSMRRSNSCRRRPFRFNTPRRPAYCADSG